MKLTSKLMVLAIVAGGTMFAQPRLSVGIGVGGYAQPPAYGSGYGYDRPPMPGPGYFWVDGYWTTNYGHRYWTNGYWSAPVYRNFRRDFDHDDYRRDFDRRDRDRRDFDRRDDRRDYDRRDHR